MAQRFFIIFLLILLLPDLFIYRSFIVKETDNVLLRILYWVPTTLLLAGLIYFTFLTSKEMIGSHLPGTFSVIFLFFVMPKVVFSLIMIIGWPFIHLAGWSKTPFLWIATILTIADAGAILYGAIYGKNRFVVKHVDFTSAYVPPAFDGYKIALLSDIHIGSWSGKPNPVQQFVELTNKQKPDIIVFTGDLVNQRAVELNGLEHILARLDAPDGVYSVLGNHDFGPYYPWDTKEERVENLIDLKRRQADMGWVLLNNENTILHRGNDSIALLGVENDGEPPFSKYADLPKAIKGTEGMFQVLLSHNPTHWCREVLPESSIDLMLAGHTHALQVELFGWSPSSRFYKEWNGMYHEGDRGLYVNIGVGHVGFPFRFGAWPEITVITLRRSTNE
ncbi:metallophosphoesterase [Bacteroides sp. 519]|uniref:metallophosphoesterase n=1 Tax=Bacteroides sp. 519 TaxID=2302937 RepID=UPI0013D54D77|nr:metallophosphoesterase [Bacteroides sp. 519]NDV60095.1 metallophosphoesterase [Bacteroides sp. 519]